MNIFSLFACGVSFEHISHACKFALFNYKNKFNHSIKQNVKYKQSIMWNINCDSVKNWKLILINTVWMLKFPVVFVCEIKLVIFFL